MGVYPEVTLAQARLRQGEARRPLAEGILRRLERDVFPFVGSRPVAEVTASEILTVVRRIVDRGAVETAHRALQNIAQAMRYTVVTGRAVADPTPALRGALPLHRPTHHRAITDPEELGALLRVLDGYSGSPTVRAALGLAPRVFVRPCELRHMEWCEIDFDAEAGRCGRSPARR